MNRYIASLLAFSVLLLSSCKAPRVRHTMPPEPPGARKEFGIKLRTSQPSTLADPGFRVTSISTVKGDVSVSWQEGQPPFQVQQAPFVVGPWTNVGPPVSVRSAQFPASITGFIRIVGSSGPAPGSVVWQRHIGGLTGNDSAAGLGVVSHPSGGVVACGFFAGTVGDGVKSVTSESVNTDCLLARYTTDGSLVWLKRIGGILSDSARSVGVDGSGNILVSGSVSGTVNFGLGNTSQIGSQDGFVAKYSPDGQTCLFAKRFGIASGSANILKVAGLEDSVLFLCTFSGGSIDFGGGSAGGPGALVKLSSDGSFVWQKRTGQGNGLSVLGNKVWVSGLMFGTMDIGNGPVASIGPVDAFAARFRDDGASCAYEWSAHWGGIGSSASASGVNGDATGNASVCGTFRGTVDLGGQTVSCPNNQNAIFVSAYSQSGSLLSGWPKQFGGSGTGDGASSVVWVNGDVAFTGTVTGGIDLNGDGEQQLGSSPDCFVGDFTGGAIYRWGSRYNASGGDTGNSIVLDNSRLVVCGKFGGTVDFGGGPMTSSGSAFSDLFVVLFNP